MKNQISIAVVLVLCFSLFFACSDKVEPDGEEVPQEISKMAENIMNETAAMFEKGISVYSENNEAQSASGSQREQSQFITVSVPIAEKKILDLSYLEKRDVSEKMKTVEGFEQIKEAFVEVYKFSYYLTPKNIQELREVASSYLDEEGHISYEGNVLFGLIIDGRYIELVKNYHPEDMYDQDWDGLMEMNLGSKVDSRILETDKEFILKVGESETGLGINDNEEEIPLTFDWGEAVYGQNPFALGSVVMSYEEGKFITDSIDYYEFNRDESYSATIYIMDEGGYGITVRGIKAGDSESEFFTAYKDSGLNIIRYEGKDEKAAEENGEIACDYIYAIEKHEYQKEFFHTQRFYIKDNAISTIELAILPAPEFPEQGKYEGYSVVLAESQKDCNIASESFRKYEIFQLEDDWGVYDVSIPIVKGVSDADSINTRINEDWQDIISAPDNNYKDLGSGFGNPVIKVYYEEYKIGNIYEVCVFYEAYSGQGSGIVYSTMRYAYDIEKDRALTDEEFLTAMGYDKEFIAEQCLVQCMDPEDAEAYRGHITYENIEYGYYIDGEGQIVFRVNFYS